MKTPYPRTNRNALKGIFASVAAASMLLPGAPPLLGQTWTLTSAPTNCWQSLACSADGRRVFAAALCGGPVYASADSGSTWNTNAVSGEFWWLASSADANTTFGAIVGGILAGSTNSGATWAKTFIPPPSPSAYALRAVACSSDGCRAVSVGERVFHSANSGTTWVEGRAPRTTLFSVACSADGTKWLAGAGPGGIYASSDLGSTWIPTSGPEGIWWSVASSADGTKLAGVVATNGNATLGLVYTSADSGGSWTPSSAPVASWSSIACSADGRNLVAAIYGGGIYTSADCGSTWTTNDVPTTNWICVASSADGNRLFAAARFGGIYAFQSTPSPVLNIALANSTATLSWRMPSSNFALQVSPELEPTNWVTLTNPPTLNWTNLNLELVVPPAGANSYYRLAAQPQQAP